MDSYLIGGICLLSLCSTSSHAADPFQWLEEVHGDRALEWVDAQNVKSEARLAGDERYEPIREYLYRAYNDPDKLAAATFVGDRAYNFWTDAEHPRGLLRETSVESYRSGNPQWETVLDLDALSRQENVSWYYAGSDFGSLQNGRALLRLSRDGRDAVRVREFDLRAKTFVAGGFDIPEAKTRASWFDANHVFVATNEGEGTLNASGYPIILRLLKRGDQLADAPVLLRGAPEEKGSGVFGWVEYSQSGERTGAGMAHSRTYDDISYYLLNTQDPTNVNKRFPFPVVPQSSFLGSFKGDLVMMFKAGWPAKNIATNTLAVLTPDFDRPENSKVTELAATTGDAVVRGASITDDYLYVDLLRNVRETLERYTKTAEGYAKAPLAFPPNLQVSIRTYQSPYIQFHSSDFLSPPSIHIQPESMGTLSPAVYRAKSRFDESRYEVEQLWATSKDGTQIPYFIVLPKARNREAANLAVRIDAYGGFNIAMSPSYLGSSIGKFWLEEAGGAYVVANIRGGGEFGNAWHQAARLTNRNKSFEDLIAVGEDLVKRKIADPDRMGIEGGSNGGLLTAAVTMLRPDLFRAVESAVPLTDMFRFHLLLAGASWTDEYGNPEEPEIREFWAKYSPYQNVKAGVTYPEIYFNTSTADDRVHPAHARKMVARLEELGHPVIFFENREGGHGGTADGQQWAKAQAMKCVYLMQKLVDP